MKLYEISNQFSNLFEQLEAISSYEPSKTNSGLYADDDGCVIIDLEAYKEKLAEYERIFRFKPEFYVVKPAKGVRLI